MPEDMRFYDELRGTRNLLEDIQKNYAATLEALDIDTPSSLQPANIADEALGHYLNGRKIENLEKVIRGLDSRGSPTSRLLLQGRRVEVEPLADRKIEHSGESVFFKASSHKKGGTITHISLKPSD